MREEVASYQSLIERIIGINNLSKQEEVLLLTPLSGNTYATRIFDLIAKKYLTSVKTSLSTRDIPCVLRLGIGLREIRTIAINIIITSLKALSLLFLCNYLNRLKPLPTEGILFDGFIGLNDFDKHGKFNNRYYSEDIVFTFDRQNIYFPVFASAYSPFVIFRLLKKMRNAGLEFLLAEQLLGFRDILSSLYDSIRLPLGIGVLPFSLPKALESQLRLELINDIGNSELFCCLQRIRTVKNLSDIGFRIKAAVVWYENIPVQKALIIGLRKYYPEVIIHGYQTFVTPESFICKHPSSLEISSCLAPDKLHIPYKHFALLTASMLSEIPLVAAPLRPRSIEYIADIKCQTKTERPRSDTVGLFLPYKDDDFNRVLRQATDILENVNILIVIIPHPARRKAQVPAIERFRSNYRTMKMKKPRLVIDLETSFSATELTHVIGGPSTSLVDAYLQGKIVGLLGKRGCLWTDLFYQFSHENSTSLYYLHDDAVELFLNATPNDPIVATPVDTVTWLGELCGSGGSEAAYKL